MCASVTEVMQLYLLFYLCDISFSSKHLNLNKNYYHEHCMLIISHEFNNFCFVIEIFKLAKKKYSDNMIL